MKYAIKCDECKKEIGRTDSMRESAAGGRCVDCISTKMLMTEERRLDVLAGIRECERIVGREMRYSPKFRNMEYIASYEATRMRLAGYLVEAEKTGWFTPKMAGE